MSSESQYNDVSNDISSVWKYSQLFTHKSNTFLAKIRYSAYYVITSPRVTACCCERRSQNIGWAQCIFFVHFSSTPIFRFWTWQESNVSNDILFERKYSQLFTHESNIFLLKQLYQRWRHSLFIDCAQTDGLTGGKASKTWSPPVSLRSLGRYNKRKRTWPETSSLVAAHRAADRLTCKQRQQLDERAGQWSGPRDHYRLHCKRQPAFHCRTPD